MLYIIKPQRFNPKFEAVGCFIENNQEILLLHRQDSRPQGNTWGIPSGKINPEEKPLEAMVREIKEETSFELDPSKIRYFGKTYVSYPEFDFIYHLFHTSMNPRLKVELNDEEHKDYLWTAPTNAFDLDLVPDLDICIRMVYGV